MPISKRDLELKGGDDTGAEKLNPEDQKNGEETTAKTQFPATHTTSAKGTSKSFALPPGILVTDSTGKWTSRSTSPASVPASLICKVRSQYVRLQRLERITKSISEKERLTLAFWQHGRRMWRKLMLSMKRNMLWSKQLPRILRGKSLLRRRVS